MLRQFAKNGTSQSERAENRHYRASTFFRKVTAKSTQAGVIAVIPTANCSKAAIKVRVGFKTRDPRILPEMGARVAFLNDSE